MLLLSLAGPWPPARVVQIRALSLACGHRSARRSSRIWARPAARRQEDELSPTAEYMRMSYYERQLAAFLEMLVKYNFLPPPEIESGTPATSSPKAVPALTPEKAAVLIANGMPTSRNVAVAPRFRLGERVRARNTHPVGHTRLPRYARGKFGIIHRDHGVFVFPDTNAHL